MAPRAAKRIRPSFAGLLRIRSKIRTVLASLGHAQAKTADVFENARLNRAKAEVGKQLMLFERTIDAIKRLQETKRRYEARIAAVDQKSERLLGRRFRGGQRWLRRWETL